MATYTRPNLGGSFEQGDDASAVARPDLTGAWEQAAAAASGAPTLSDLKAVSVTATTVQGTYDYAF